PSPSSCPTAPSRAFRSTPPSWPSSIAGPSTGNKLPSATPVAGNWLLIPPTAATVVIEFIRVRSGTVGASGYAAYIGAYVHDDPFPVLRFAARALRFHVRLRRSDRHRRRHRRRLALRRRQGRSRQRRQLVLPRPRRSASLCEPRLWRLVRRARQLRHHHLRRRQIGRRMLRRQHRLLEG